MGDRRSETALSVRVVTPSAINLARTLAPFRYGSADPAFISDISGIWRAFGTPEGDATAQFSLRERELHIAAWGSGAEWVAHRAAMLAGLDDNAEEFAPEHPLVSTLHRRFPGVRFGRTDLVMESLVPAILSQKITGKEAFLSWRQLLTRHGSTAPGPTPRPMRVPPRADVVRSLDDAQWHQLGVDRAHRETLRRAAARASSIERLSARTVGEAVEALQSIRGIGVWTAAEVAQRAWGSPYHPSFGDYHIPSSVGIAFTGEPTDDDGMARLLEPFRPHRSRVVRLIELARIGAPRRGPRRTVPNYLDI